MGRIHNSIRDLVTKAVPVVAPTMTAYELEQLLRTKAKTFETINYIYLTNRAKKLVGVLSIQELFHLKATSTLESFLKTNIISVNEHAKPIEVAELALKHTIKAVPVVSSEGKFLGVVPSDKIISLLSHEHTKDVLRLAGVHHKNVQAHEAVLTGTSWQHVKMRLPWLVLGLFGGMAAALVVGLFEETLADELILAAFIPAIVYMADAVGSQTQMLFVRALSIDTNLKVRAYLWRETMVNALLGLILGVLIFGVTLLWLQSMLVSLILGTSIFLTVLFTVLVAIILPWFFFVRGHDPAVASGPLATVIRDILSLCIYLLVASLFLV